MAGMLYLVPTPIGNLGDISTRCRETLENADFIAAEDTRVSLKLLNHLGIKKSLVVLKVADKALFDAQMVQQLQAHAGIFRGDEIRLLQGAAAAIGNIPQIADGGGD